MNKVLIKGIAKGIGAATTTGAGAVLAGIPAVIIFGGVFLIATVAGLAKN